MKKDDFAALTHLPLFRDVPSSSLQAITRDALLQRFPRGTALFEQGQTPDFLHVLLEGSVELIGVADDGRQSVVEILQPIDSFILAAALTDTPYLMAARVVDPARLLLIPASALRTEIARSPALALAMMASLARQFRMMVRQIKNLKLRTSTQRVGCYLLMLMEESGGAEEFILPYDKRRIAARLGMTPENLSRAFAALRPLGVTTRGNRVRISTLKALQNECHLDKLIDTAEADVRIAVGESDGREH